MSVDRSRRRTGLILFLDLDGVLIVPGRFSRGTWTLPSFRAVEWAFLPSATAELRRVLTAMPNARIVLSSSWRLSNQGGGWEIVERLFTMNGARDVLSRFHPLREARCTPRVDLGTDRRLREIGTWVRRHRPRAVAALDDDPLVVRLPGGIYVDPERGLTAADADRAIALLSIGPSGAGASGSSDGS